MRNKKRSDALRRVLERSRYEVLPTASALDKIVTHIPRDVVVTVTASPSKGLAATLELTEKLVGQGYVAVPHLAARMVSGRAELADICDRLVALGVRTIFVPAGDADPPAGDYKQSLDLLEDLAALGRPIPDVGVTGYPESHPAIHDDLTVQAMWDKRRFATHIVSNLTFDPAAFRTWVARMRSRGITVPLLVGLPGPVERTKLLAMATKIGVGESTRFLVKHKGTFARIASPGFSPERFLDKCAPTIADPESMIEGLHVFTFNQIAETERWRQDLLARLGGPVSPATA
jgi:methylenetetrahydrofolate reductase (NADPH)